MENRREERFSTFLNYIICFTLVGITVLATFLMPQIYGYNVDRNTIGKVNFVARENVELSTDLNLSVKDKTAIVTNLAGEGGLSLSLNLEGSQLHDQELIEAVSQEIRWAVECGVLPSHILNMNMSAQTGSLTADYYILSSGVSEYGEMALWKINYNDYNTWDVTLLVDAENYKIYYGEFGGNYMVKGWTDTMDMRGEGEYTSLCMQYYEAEYAEQLWKECIFEIEDAGIFGWAQENNAPGRADGQFLVFGYDVFWEYFFGQSVFDFYNLKYENDTTMIQNQND